MPTRPRWPGPTKRERPASERIRRPREPLTADPLDHLYDPDAPNPEPRPGTPQEEPEGASAGYLLAALPWIAIGGILIWWLR